MIKPGSIVISRNILLRPEMIPSREQNGNVLASHLSVISPAFEDVFRTGILRVIRGIIDESTLYGAINTESPTPPFNFGLEYADKINTPQGGTVGFVPYVPSENLKLMDDPALAADSFHTNLVEDTNKALEVLGSPYRLDLANLAIRS